ncbi:MULTISPECIES: NADH-quinone oxidoreductase subunit C [Gordonia]|uniref:NADH-quinone oxidoreductase subunit C n=1 Tax=Gordonia terrae C-6 TaxID=1316928 RepID=R7Y3J0_9ACTN|nr:MULTISPECIES: NADH-quinone oxidoreductase subunit C [Gordonia]AFR47000.1 NADH:ubiquinone oxidoreductase 27 kD subunit [Gordonia sp. KTR9]EON30608.1 NADH dehydrogenase subunit C [Gordonia terrae C-6]
MTTPAGHQDPENPAPPPPDSEQIGVRHGLFGPPGTGDTSGYGGLVRPVTLPPSSSRPYGGYFDEIADRLRDELGDRHDDAIEKVVVFRDEMTIHVVRRHLPAVALALRNAPALRFELCLGVSGVHYPGDADRELHAVYPLASLTHGRRVRLEVAAPDADPHIPSICDIYPTNDWHERETYDFFGIVFDGHRSLTRIEMPDDWEGHPQRKDYPLGGVPVEYKGTRIDPPDRRRSYN